MERGYNSSWGASPPSSATRSAQATVWHCLGMPSCTLARPSYLVYMSLTSKAQAERAAVSFFLGGQPPRPPWSGSAGAFVYTSLSISYVSSLVLRNVAGHQEERKARAKREQGGYAPRKARFTPYCSLRNLYLRERLPKLKNYSSINDHCIKHVKQW
jgi:hypothetical protein